MSHGAVRFLLRIFEAVFLLALVGAAVLTWRLSQGPISIDGIAPYVSEAFTDLNPSVKFQVEHLEFKWLGLKGRPELTAVNIRLLDSAGGVIASLPSMVVRLSPAALVHGVIAPDTVSLSNPIIRFVHRADGSFGLGSAGAPVVLPNPASPVATAVSPVPEVSNSNAVAEALVQSLTRPAGEENRAGYLDTVTIDDTTLVLADEVTDQRWIAPSATLTFRRSEGNLDVQASLPVIEEGRRWNLTAHGRFAAASNTLAVDLNLDGFRPARIAKLAPQLSPLAMINLQVSGTASANFTLNGGVARLDDVHFDVKGESGQVHLPAPVDHDYPVRALALKGASSGGLDHITIDQLRVEFDRKNEPPPVVTLSAEATALNTAPHVEVRAGLPELSLAALKDLWPAGLSPTTRAWIAENLADGGLSNTDFRIAFDGPRLDSLTGSGTLLSSHLHGMTVAYMPGMPKVVDAAGMMTLTPQQVFIGMSGGHVPDSQSGRGLRITGGSVRLYGLDAGNERGDVSLDIAGEFGEVMRLVDHEPLGYAHAVGIDPTQVVGSAQINLALDFPLVKDLKRSAVAIHVKAATDGIGIPNVAFGLPLNQGKFEVKLDGKGMQVDGSASLGGIASTVSWQEAFEEGDVRASYILDPVLDNVQRPLLGLDRMPFTPPYMDGPIHAHVVYVVRRDNTSTLDATADLSTAALAIPELGWRKAVGQAANGVVMATLADDHLVGIPSFRITSGDTLDVSGAVTFTAAGELKSLTFMPSTSGETHLSGTVARDDAGAYAIDVSGPAFNSTYFWKELSRDDARGMGPKPADVESTPLRLKANVDRMWLTQDADFKEVQLNFVRDKAGIQAIDFKSKVAGTPFTISLASAGGKRAFTGESDNGGAVVRAVGMFKDIVGGKLSVKGELQPSGAVKGTAEIKDLKLIDAPPVARLLSVAALTGILDELQGKGISFKTLRVPFTYADSTITVADGEMFGSSLGLTGSGTYNFTSSMMNFDGTLVPAYAINSILNSIPVIGNILSGGEHGGGIFAATYSYRGDVATAQPSVNPLAALTPGFLRHIFDIFKPGQAAQQAQQKPPLPSSPPPPAPVAPPADSKTEN